MATRFHHWVSSSYFNKDPKLVKLLTAIAAAPEASREQLDQLLFPEDPFNYFRISNLLSYLMRMLREFLAWEELKAEGHALNSLSLKRSMRLGMEEVFKSESLKLQRKLSQNTVDREDDLYYRAQLEELLDYDFLGKGGRQVHDSLRHKITALEAYYVLSMLRSLCQWLNRRFILGAETPLPQLELLKEHLSAGADRFQAYPAIRMYQAVFEMLQTPELAQAYQHLKGLLDTYEKDLDVSELSELYQYMRNHCIRQSNRGQRHFTEELLQVYQTMLRLKLLEVDGYIGHGDIKNIVTLGITLNRLNWTEAFLAEVRAQIHPDQRENAWQYNLAYLHYARQEFRPALRLLTQVVLEDVFYDLGARTLLLKIYYEQEDQEALAALLHAFENALRRKHHLSAYQRDAYRQLISGVRRLDQLRAQTDLETKNSARARLTEFQNQLIKGPAVSQRAWLLNMVARLLD